MKKPIIFCIVGESASGKSAIVKYINKRYGIDLIQSYTTRPMRQVESEAESAGERLDHKFLTDEQFDNLLQEDMIAYTKFGEYRYCCLKKDVAAVNLYVIDEDGLKMLMENYGTEFDIVSVRVHCRRDIRVLRARKDNPDTYMERIARDDGRYNMEFEMFDHVIVTNQSDKIVGASIDKAIQWELIVYGIRNISIDTKVKFNPSGITVR